MNEYMKQAHENVLHSFPNQHNSNQIKKRSKEIQVNGLQEVIAYDEKRKKFCLIAKDDCKNGSAGITGEWGNGFYAESDDCIHFEIAENPLVYTRNLHWQDGSKTKQGNLERPSLLFDENGEPTHIFCASGFGEEPYNFKGTTYVVSMMLKKK